MDLESLEELLAEFLPPNFRIETDDDGQLVIKTRLTEGDDGDLEPFDSDEELEKDENLESLDDLIDEY